MGTSIRRAIALAVLVLTGASESIAEASPPSDALVMYTGHGYERLTDQQKALVLRAGEALRPQGRDVWFVMVEFSGKYSVWAWVCFVPDETTPRLRKGRFANVHLGRDRVLDGDFVVTSSGVEEYVQVARGDERFSEKGGQLPALIPDSPDLPMRRPTYKPRVLETGRARRDDPFVPLPDELLLRLMDFARAQFDDQGVSDAVCTVRVIGKNKFLFAAGVEDWGGRYFEAAVVDGKLKNLTDGIGMWNDSLLIFYPPPGEAGDDREDEDKAARNRLPPDVHRRTKNQKVDLCRQSSTWPTSRS